MIKSKLVFGKSGKTGLKSSQILIYLVVATVFAFTCGATGQDYSAESDIKRSFRVDLRNALTAPAPHHTFVEGQKVCIVGKTYYPEYLEAIGELDNALARVAKMEASNDPEGLNKAGNAEGLARQRYEKATAAAMDKTVLHDAMSAITFEFYTRDGDRAVAKADVILTAITDISRPGVGDMEPDHFHTPFIYQFDSEQLGVGQFQLRAFSQEHEIIREVNFEIVSSAGASNQQLCDKAYVEAKLASSNGDYEGAIRLALEAIEFGQPLDYNVMASHLILGDEYDKLGEFQQAYDAYAKAQDIVIQAFPKSSIRVILDSQVRQSKEKLEN